MARKARRRTWGTGSLTEREGRWWIRWRENGRRLCKSYATKELAEEVLAKITRDVAAGGAGLPRDYSEVPNLNTLAKAWLERRQKTHRSAMDDRSRWKLHLGPAFGKMKPHEVDAAKLRQFIEGKLAAGLAPASVGRALAVLSTFFADICEQGHAPCNPVTSLPRSTRRLVRSDYDTRSTPFLQTTADIRRVFLALPEPFNVAFAVGALAGLRVGETLGLSWEDVDLPGRRIHVHRQMQDGRLGPLKDDEPRLVPLLTSLAPILAEWKLKAGPTGLLFKPVNLARGGRPDLGTVPAFIRPHTLAKHLNTALTACKLPRITWYQATRHTFASQFVLGGGGIELLSKIMGRASITTTEIYSHLRHDLFAEKAFDAVTVDLARPKGDVVPIRDVSGPNGQTMGTSQEDNAESKSA
jgi:integrase